MNTSIFDIPRPDFMRVDDEGFKHEFLPITEKVSKHIGALFTQNVFEEGDALSHQQLATWIGATAVKLIPDTSMRQWSVSVDDQVELSDLLWSKAIWTLVHVLPIGFMVSRHRFGSQNYTWNPAIGALRNATSATNSNRLFNGFPISQAVMHKLFPEVLDSPHAMLTFAILDTFSSRPNTDNPFYNGIRDAIRMTLIRHPYPIPFFWTDFIQAFFAHNAIDLKKFEAAMKQITTSSSVAFTHNSHSHAPEHSEDNHQRVDTPNVQERETPTLTPKTTPPVIQESPVQAPIIQPASAVTPSLTPNQAFHREALTTLYVAWGQTDNVKSQAQSMRDIVMYWSKLAAEEVQRGQFAINAPSAFAYIHQRNVYITEGGIKRLMALVNDKETDWLDWMTHVGLLTKIDGELNTKDKSIPLTTWRLRARVSDYFIPDLATYQDSSVFAPRGELVT